MLMASELMRAAVTVISTNCDRTRSSLIHIVLDLMVPTCSSRSLETTVQQFPQNHGDDDDAKSEVTRIFEAAGFFVIDLGGLRSGGELQQVGGPLSGVNLIRLAEST